MGDEPLLRERAARLTLAIGLMGVALRIPREFPRRHWRSLAVPIGPGMVGMWAISTALVHLVLGLPLLLSAVIGAIVTPTDPIASTPVVTGTSAEENIPERVRHTISLESGANDGLAYLFLFLPFLLLTRPGGEALNEWIVHVLLWQVGVATVLGLALGYAAARLLRLSEAREWIHEDWRLIYTVALALLAVGAGRLVGSDELLVVFAAGAAFAQVASGEEREEEDRGQEAVNRFFAIPIFVVLGATGAPLTRLSAGGRAGRGRGGVGARPGRGEPDPAAVDQDRGTRRWRTTCSTPYSSRTAAITEPSATSCTCISAGRSTNPR